MKTYKELRAAIKETFKEFDLPFEEAWVKDHVIKRPAGVTAMCNDFPVIFGKSPDKALEIACDLSKRIGSGSSIEYPGIVYYNKKDFAVRSEGLRKIEEKQHKVPYKNSKTLQDSFALPWKRLLNCINSNKEI